MTLSKVALTRVVWAYNITGNICEKLFYNLLKLSIYTYLYSTVVMTGLELLIQNPYHFLSYSCLILILFNIYDKLMCLDAKYKFSLKSDHSK